VVTDKPVSGEISEISTEKKTLAGTSEMWLASLNPPQRSGFSMI
jgi:hypothetical protein